MSRTPILFLALPLLMATASQAVTYGQNVKPILDANCIECHNATNQDLSLQSFPFSSKTTSNQSIIVQDILSMLDANPAKMPPGNRPKLPQDDITTIQDWLNGGLQP